MVINGLVWWGLVFLVFMVIILRGFVLVRKKVVISGWLKFGISVSLRILMIWLNWVCGILKLC